MLVMASFILLTISLLSASFWSLLRLQTKTLVLKEGQLRAYYAARGGVEDAVYELKSGTTWGDINRMSDQWNQENETTFFKSTIAAPALTNFDYPVTLSVQLLGNLQTEAITINSNADITSKGQQFSSALQARVIRTLSGDFHVVSVERN